MHSDELYFEEVIITQEFFKQNNVPRGIQFVSCKFKDIDISNFKFDHAKFIECEFTKCNLSNIQLINCSLREITFKECKALGVNFSTCQKLFTWAAYQSVFDYSVFQGLDAPKIIFQECSLKEVDFTDSKFQESSFQCSNLKGAVFNHANLVKSDFIGAKNYSIDPAYSNIRKSKFSMPEAITLLDSMDLKITY